ncbi:MAG: phasin family protein [Archangiaceae bacterium]|nr:phasin family protein [Archangiaceae bacterium]
MDGDNKQPKLKELEKAVEEAVKRALGKVKVPRREELQQLNQRLDALAQRIEALSK